MRQAWFRTAWFAAGVLLALVVLEFALRSMPVSKGLHRAADYMRWPLQYTEPHFPYTYSIGWDMRNAHRGVTNNYGHVAPFDFRARSRPVIVMGDSYVESLMNDYADSLQGQLGRRLETPESVYGFGVSGASASDYVALAQMVRAEFEPTAAVILVTDGDLSESLQRAVGTRYLIRDAGRLALKYEPIREVPLSSRIRDAIGDISLHRYFQINLHFAAADVLKVFRADAPRRAIAPAPDKRLDEQREVADWFLTALPSSLGLQPRCIVLLLDADRYAIYKPDLASVPKDVPEARAYLAEEARRRGFMVQDMEPVFRQRYAQQRQKFDHWPIDRHWNRLGHGIAAEEAYRMLVSGRDPGPPACLSSARPAA